MRRYLKIIYLLVVLLIPYSLYSQVKNPLPNNYYQKLFEQIQSQYGPDQTLLNGIFYQYPYRNAKGHPFFHENRFYHGDLVFNNILYKNMELKFDIFNQQLILNYYFNGNYTPLILPTELISYFSLEGKQFKTVCLKETGTAIYQVLGLNDSIQCLYQWSKQRRESDHLGQILSYKFTFEKRKTFLSINGELHRYMGNSSFLRVFPKNTRQQIKKFFKSNKIKVRYSNDNVIETLMEYCNEYLKTDSK